MKFLVFLVGVVVIVMFFIVMVQDSQVVDVESFFCVDVGGGYCVVVMLGDIYIVCLEGDGDDFFKVEIDVCCDGFYFDQ